MNINYLVKNGRDPFWSTTYIKIFVSTSGGICAPQIFPVVGSLFSRILFLYASTELLVTDFLFPIPSLLVSDLDFFVVFLCSFIL